MPLRRYYSDSLKDVFWITVLLILVELFVAATRANFANLILVQAVFAMLLLGYFGERVVKGVLVGMLIGVLLDVLWLIVKSKVRAE